MRWKRRDTTLAPTRILAHGVLAGVLLAATVVGCGGGKQEPEVWGDPTVLNVDALPANEKALFTTLDLGPATLSPEELGPVLPEPHPSWVSALEEAWTKRYGAGSE